MTTQTEQQETVLQHDCGCGT